MEDDTRSGGGNRANLACGMGDVLSTLGAIERLLGERSPTILHAVALRPPAEESAKRALAMVLGMEQLPPNADALFSWHNGQTGDESFLEDSADLGGFRLKSAEEAAQDMRDAHEWTLEHWKTSYLPFLDSGGGNYGVIDVATGTVEFWDHEREPPFMVADSLDAFFQIHLDAWKWRLENRS